MLYPHGGNIMGVARCCGVLKPSSPQRGKLRTQAARAKSACHALQRPLLDRALRNNRVIELGSHTITADFTGPEKILWKFISCKSSGYLTGKMFL